MTIKHLFCKHRLQTDLIFSGGKNTHHDKERCTKCGKSKTVFSGTRTEWMLHHQIKH